MKIEPDDHGDIHITVIAVYVGDDAEKRARAHRARLMLRGPEHDGGSRTSIKDDCNYDAVPVGAVVRGRD